jgi:DNA (cytosine-5)-methyltransferase 1
MQKFGPKTIDLFSGCGGMSLGFHNSGFNLIGAFDNWGPAVEVYNANFDHKAVTIDLNNSDTIKLIQKLSPEIIVGGPPCQDFSSAGPNQFHSSRAGLLETFVDIVEKAIPRYFVIENVPRIRFRPVYMKAVARLRSLGYGLTEQILDACYCGVPQVRKRVFLIGGFKAKDGFLKNILMNQLADKKLTLREYFGSKLNTDYYFRVPTNYSRRGVFSVDEPSLTIRAVDRPIPKGYPRHPDDPVPIGPKVRAFTVLERSCIQTFPTSFVFKGSKTDLNKMIGNAVPVKLAEFVAKALRKYIEENDAKK